MAKIATKNGLFRAIQTVWQEIELDYIRKLYHSILDRLDNAIKMKGHLTKYWVYWNLDLYGKYVKASARKNVNKRRHIESDEYLCLLTVAVTVRSRATEEGGQQNAKL